MLCPEKFCSNWLPLMICLPQSHLKGKTASFGFANFTGLAGGARKTNQIESWKKPRTIKSRLLHETLILRLHLVQKQVSVSSAFRLMREFDE